MRLELRDSLEPIFADTTLAAGRRPRRRLDVARGGTVAVHLLVDGVAAGQTLRLTVTEAGRPVRAAQWFRLLDVPVEQNTGLVGFTCGTPSLDVTPHTGQPNRHNPHVIRRAPFRVFDVMQPVDGAVRADAAPIQAIRLQVPIARDARPGPRRWILRVATDQAAADGGLDLTVYPARIPPLSAASFPYTNWFSYQNIALRHGLKMWSPSYWSMLERYAALMAHGRQSVFWIPLNTVFNKTRQGPILDPVRLQRLVRLFTDAGMQTIEGGHVAHRTGGNWTAATFDGVFGGRATLPEGNTILAGVCRQLREVIDRNGWRDRWIQHATDEPIPVNAIDYRILVGMLRRHFPGFPILDATQDPSLAGSVDIWCPQIQEYQRDRDAYEAHRRLGDRVWYYTCCFPGGPWLNRLLDQELLRPVLLGWGGALFRLDGFLHWGLNHYREDQDPFQQSVLPNHGGGQNALPAGDTHIVYPGVDGPWSSLRLEAHREGFEDLELLRRLQARDPRRASRIIALAIRGFDQYVKDVASFRRARRALLAAS